MLCIKVFHQRLAKLMQRCYALTALLCAVNARSGRRGMIEWQLLLAGWIVTRWPRLNHLTESHAKTTPLFTCSSPLFGRFLPLWSGPAPAVLTTMPDSIWVRLFPWGMVSWRAVSFELPMKVRSYDLPLFGSPCLCFAPPAQGAGTNR